MTNPKAIDKYYQTIRGCKCRELNKDKGPKDAYEQCKACKRAMKKLAEDPSALGFFIGDH